jgi:hypothetical protein
MAYVVRVTHPAKDDQYKAFTAVPDAKALFDSADVMVRDEREATYLYEVPGEDDLRAGVQAVQAGKAIIFRRDTHHEWVNLSAEEQSRRAEL